MKATPKQNDAMIKVHQLLSIAKEIAERSDLPWLASDIEALDMSVRHAHKEANK